MPELRNYPQFLTAARCLDLFGRLHGIPATTRGKRIEQVLADVDLDDWIDGPDLALVADNFGEVRHSHRRPGVAGVRLLNAIHGLDFVEMDRIREYSFCCGGGGGVPQAHPDLARETARLFGYRRRAGAKHLRIGIQLDMRLKADDSLPTLFQRHGLDRRFRSEKLCRPAFRLCYAPQGVSAPRAAELAPLVCQFYVVETACVYQ